MPDQPLSRSERRLRGLLLFNAALAVVFVIVYLAGALWDGEQFRFVVNSVAKDGLFAALCLLGVADVRRRGWTALLVAFGYACLIAAEAVMLAVGGQDPVTTFGVTIQATPYLVSWMAIDVVLAVALVVAWRAAERERLGLLYLGPLSHRSLVALADVLVIGDDEDVPPADVARNVDRYLDSLQSERRAEVRRALALLSPLALLGPGARLRTLERRFVADVARRHALAPLRRYLQAAIRVASQMAYLGYYGDERSWEGVGYVPFSRRRDGRLPRPSDRPGPRLTSLSGPADAHYDAIVVGSGAGGAIAAYRLAEAGRRVLVLERGPHADPSEFGEDEVAQYLRLYGEGALQLATDYRLQVLQGMCVGGSTTVNNAVCFDPPDAVVARWAQRGIEPAGLAAAVEQVRAWLGVRRMDGVASAGGLRFAEGAKRLDLPVEVVEANISGTCLGCGYCNMGCGFGAKQSMLDSVLPWAQHEFPARVHVLPEFHADKVVHRGGRATGVEGTHRGRHVVVHADEVVVAAGAVASSVLLQRSGIGGDAVGRGLYFNINSPLTAEFPERVDSYAGLQMSHAYVPPVTEGTPAFVLETWFNPPGTQALAMPGWFRQHYANMRRYAHMACGGALVGTTTPARVKPGGRRGARIDYTPSREDLGNVIAGLSLMGRIFLAGGASRVMPATFAFHEFSSEGALSALGEYVSDNADLLLTTAHPQGGNAIGEPGQGGVVDADFRVHGFANLYVCDASVFPSSVTVNPQLTVMALAQYAAKRITGHEPRVVTQAPLPPGTVPEAGPEPGPAAQPPSSESIRR